MMGYAAHTGPIGPLPTGDWGAINPPVPGATTG